MKRRILIAVLALGTLGGFAAGAVGLRCHSHYAGHGRRAAFEQRVADICVEAAQRTQKGSAK